MRLLLNTHIFLWFISGDARLPADWSNSIRDAGNAVFLSVVPVWEAIVNHRPGMLPLLQQRADYKEGDAVTSI